jgi:tRNA (uracil-5-)-methyltransferase TRM9
MPAQGRTHGGAQAHFVQDARSQKELLLRILASGQPGFAIHPPYTTRVHPDVAATLAALNREFYQRFAPAFASKRPRLQPGAARAIREVGTQASVLDLGCGHGLLPAALAAAGHRGRYVGLDSSQGLLDRARGSVRHAWADFLKADLADPEGMTALAAMADPSFDWIFALAVLHHLPGKDSRQRAAAQARTWLAAGGRMVVSVWDFLASPRWAARIVPWAAVGLEEDQVDPEDHLLDWREGGRGIRYVHRFTQETLQELGESAGFTVLETYRSDGDGGRLGLYQVWRAG